MRTSDPYTVEITPSAQRDMNRLDLPIARRVAAALRELALDPRPSTPRLYQDARP